MTNSVQDDTLLDVSDFARSEYGLSAATSTAMLRYGHALLAIAGADGRVSPAELEWLVSHQRKFGAPEDIIAQYATFDYESADLKALVLDSVTNVPTWTAGPSLIYHAIQMCAADGVYSTKEQKKGSEAAALLGVPSDIVLTIHALVEMETATTTMRKALFHTHTA
jgi:tellurite resistance protein